jgi:hypothetical protein
VADAESWAVRELPREVVDCSAAFIHPQIKWGGCAVTFAEAKYFYETAVVPILMYHRIASGGPQELSPYMIDPATFERQLRYLQRYGYSTAKSDDVWKFHCVPNFRTPGKLVALTFD